MPSPTQPILPPMLKIESPSALGVGAIVEDNNDEIPHNFLAGTGHNVELARRRWQETKQWRKANNVDNVLNEPQPHFNLIKGLYPHGIICQGKDGRWIYLERPGHAKLSQVWKSGLTVKDLEKHYTFITEYLWRVLDPSENGRLVSIFDADGCSLADLAGDSLKMFQTCSSLLGAHYPEKSYKIFIINAPMWMKMAWTVMCPWLDPNTCTKITIIKKGKDYFKYLEPHISRDQLPPELDGTSPFRLHETPAEKKMFEYVQTLNSSSSKSSKP